MHADSNKPDATQPVAWRYWNEKSRSWNTTTSSVVADVMRESGRAVESLYAAPQASEAVRWVVTDDMRSAVRFAPSSAHWSERLKEFFGPDAREGINALERQLREARAENYIIGRITVKGKGRSSVELDTSHADLPEGEYLIRAALSAQPGAQTPHPKQHNDGGADA